MRASTRVKRPAVKPYSPSFSKPSAPKSKARPRFTLELTEALEIVRQNGGYEVTEVSVRCKVPKVEKASGRSIRDAFRADIGSSHKHVSDLEFDQICPGCNMLLLDSDIPRTSADLHRRLRQGNVSVCVLRSRSLYKDRSEAGNLDELANMGAFQSTLEKWGLANGPDESIIGTPWGAIRDRLGQCDMSGADPISLPVPSWQMKAWAVPADFKKWWQKVVDKPLAGLNVPPSSPGETFWPTEGHLSPVGSNLTESDLFDRLQECVGAETKIATVDEGICALTMATLVGGYGSPPHIDTSVNLLSPSNVDLTTAVGHLIQGVKYFWAVPPKGGHAQKFLDFYQTRLPVGLDPKTTKKCLSDFRRHQATGKEDSEVPDTVAQTVFRDAIYAGKVPHVFQGKFSMGWPSEAQWNEMKDHGVCNHFHALYAGDIYIVLDGVFHAVVNHPVYPPVATAQDDDWSASVADLRRLTPSVLK